MDLNQAQLLRMMSEIDDICKKNKIDYTLAGGSMIGAVRHRGFIPWDDDMDIYMTQSNWYKFLEVVKRDGLPEGRTLEAPELDRSFSNMFNRYTNTDTTTIHNSQIVHSDAAGQIIDIFVFDPIIDDPKAIKEYRENMMLYSDLINSVIGYQTRFDVDPARYQSCIKRCRTPEGRDQVLSELEASFRKYDEKDCTKYIMRWGLNTFVLDKEIFDGYEYMKCESAEYEVVTHFSEYLTWQYGDEWIYIPHHDDQVTHDTVADEFIDYKTVRNDYMSFLDREKLMKTYRKRKLKHLKSGPKRHRYQDSVQDLKALAAKMELEQRIAATDEDVFEMLENEEYGKLREIFDDFAKVQLSPGFIGRVDNFGFIYRYYKPMLIDIEDKYWPLFVKFLKSTERMARAFRIITIYEELNGTGNAEMEKIKDEILRTRKIVNLYFRKEYEEAYKLANELLSDDPKSYQAMKIKLRILFVHPEYSDNYKEDAEYLLSYLGRIYPDTGEVTKYQGDYLFPTDREKAIELYKEAYSHTDNGYVLLELDDIFAELGIEAPQPMEGIL